MCNASGMSRVVLVLSLIFCLVPAALSIEFGGKARVETENFVVMAYDIDVARKVGRDIERRRGEISRALGISEIGAWRPRCGIYIYDNRTAYLRGSGASPWSSGRSKVETVRKFRGQDEYVDKVVRSIYAYEKVSYKDLFSVISHELAHAVFGDAVGPSSAIPLWLDEGVANFVQEDGMDDYRKIVKKQVKRGGNVPLAVLFSEKEYPDERIQFYAESASVVDMMIDTFGNVPFLVFARLVTGGAPSVRALNDAYSSFTGSVDEFEDKWKAYVLKSY